VGESCGFLDYCVWSDRCGDVVFCVWEGGVELSVIVCWRDLWICRVLFVGDWCGFVGFYLC